MQRRTKIWIGIALLMIFITLPVAGQVPPNGEHDYGGTADGTINANIQSGSFTGSITQPPLMRYEQDHVYQTSSLFTVLNAGMIGSTDITDINRIIDFADINQTYSESFVRVSVSLHKGDFSQPVSEEFELQTKIDGGGWQDIGLVTNCEERDPGLTEHFFIRGHGGTTNPGHNSYYADMLCTFDSFNDISTIRFRIFNPDETINVDSTNSLVTFQFWDRYFFQPQSQNISGTLSGDIVGTYSGEERGQIEEINVTSNTTKTENLSVSNFTFENIMGTLSVEELDFWIPIVFFTIIAWIAFNRDATMIGLSAILGILFVLTGMGAWSIAASLVLMSLGFTLEYLAKRVWRRKRKNME